MSAIGATCISQDAWMAILAVMVLAFALGALVAVVTYRYYIVPGIQERDAAIAQALWLLGDRNVPIPLFGVHGQPVSQWHIMRQRFIEHTREIARIYGPRHLHQAGAAVWRSKRA